MTNQLPSELLDLHAYVDNQLSPDERPRVEARLEQDQDARERISDYQSLKDGLKGLFDPVAGEPIPERLIKRSWRLPRTFFAMAASLMLVVAGSWMGWKAHDSELLPGLSKSYVIEEAATSFRVFTPDLVRPVEVGADKEKELLGWLSERLGAAVSAPQLTELGFSLLGGRLIPTDAGIGALFVYEATAGQRVVMYMCPTQAKGETTEIRIGEEDDVTVFYWFDGPFSYALAGDLERPKLEALAKAAYEGTVL